MFVWMIGKAKISCLEFSCVRPSPRASATYRMLESVVEDAPPPRLELEASTGNDAAVSSPAYFRRRCRPTVLPPPRRPTLMRCDSRAPAVF